jgi:hypothetical protein
MQKDPKPHTVGISYAGLSIDSEAANLEQGTLVALLHEHKSPDYLNVQALAVIYLQTGRSVEFLPEHLI